MKLLRIFIAILLSFATLYVFQRLFDLSAALHIEPPNNRVSHVETLHDVRQKQNIEFGTSNSSWVWKVDVITTATSRIFSPKLILDGLDNPSVLFQTENGNNIVYMNWTGNHWTTTIVDSNAAMGDLAIDSQGNPHIAYYDIANQDLKYASWTGSKWIVETIDSSGDVGSSTRLNIDLNNHPHIIYQRARFEPSDPFTMYSLQYAYHNGTAWSLETIADQVRTDGSSIKVDSLGKPHVSFGYIIITGGGPFARVTAELRYATRTINGWETQLIDNEDSAQGTDGIWQSNITVDQLDNSQICYTSYTDNGFSSADLSIAQLSSSGWETQTIFAPTVGVAYDCSITVGVGNIPHISFGVTDFQNKKVYLGRLVEEQRSFQIVDDNGNSYGTSLAMDQLNNIFIVYPLDDVLNLAIGTPPSIEVIKSADTTSAYIGKLITYTYSIRSYYSETVNSLVAIDDKLGNVTLSKDSLFFGERITAVQTYVASEVDLPGPLVNTVVVTASPPVGNEISNTASTSITLVFTPAVGITQNVNPAVARVGETITYTYHLTNTGDVTLHSLTAASNKFGKVLLDKTTLSPSKGISATQTYVASEADLPGPLVNTVVVTASPPVGNEISTSSSISATVIWEAVYLPLLIK